MNKRDARIKKTADYRTENPDEAFAILSFLIVLNFVFPIDWAKVDASALVLCLAVGIRVDCLGHPCFNKKKAELKELIWKRHHVLIISLAALFICFEKLRSKFRNRAAASLLIWTLLFRTLTLFILRCVSACFLSFKKTLQACLLADLDENISAIQEALAAGNERFGSDRIHREEELAFLRKQKAYISFNEDQALIDFLQGLRFLRFIGFRWGVAILSVGAFIVAVYLLLFDPLAVKPVWWTVTNIFWFLLLSTFSPVTRYIGWLIRLWILRKWGDK